MKKTKRLKISENIEADCTVKNEALHGTLYHVQMNKSGGSSTSTPVALYFATRPEFIEGYHAHWRIDCFFKQHKLSPDPLSTGEALVDALKNEKLCTEPLWLSVHRSDDEKGKAYGELYDD